MNKIFKTASFFVVLLTFVSALLSCKTEPEPQDTTAPQDVTELYAEPRDSAVLLSWRDAEDSDIFGYEISYAKTSETSDEAESRAAVELEKNNIYVSKGTQLFFAAGLTNETEYTFTVKSVDTSGNKSKGASIKASPSEYARENPLEIVLEKPDKASSTETTITVKITSESKTERVVYKKDGDREAKVLLADKDAIDAIQDPDDNTKWTFTLDATEVNDESLNGLYTVAAIDFAGREETKQIPVYNFDFTGPEKFTVSVRYNESEKNFTANWSIPKDTNEGKENYIVSGFKDMTVSYKKKGESEAAEQKTFTAETSSFTTTALEENQTYEFTFSAQDNFGNKSIFKRYAGSSSEALSGYTIGDIILADGTNVSLNNFSKIDKYNPPVAIVAAKTENRDILGMALNFSSNKLEFARDTAPLYRTKIESIVCTPSVKSGQKVDSSTTFSGDTDGSDNWKEICKADPTAEANAEKNYSAFYWANNYGTTYKDKLAGITDGWYIPSIAELYHIYHINITAIETSLKKIYSIDKSFADKEELPTWGLSSSQAVDTYNTSCWSFSNISTGLTVQSWHKSQDTSSVIVVRKF